MNSARRVSLRAFLTAARAALDTALNDATHRTPVTFVLGNESADLDSLCSAVTLAYFRTYAPPAALTESPRHIYIPLANLATHDLSLRTELTPVLETANLSPGDLITLTDLPASAHLSSLLPPPLTKWLLVDHNAMTGELAKTYRDSIIGVIDHHDEENYVPKECPGEPRVVEKAGSCASLVIRHCQPAWAALAEGSRSGNDHEIDAEIAQVALAPILIDTTNLTSKAKVMPVDIAAATHLETIIATSPAHAAINRGEYFSRVTQAKSDISNLSLHDIFRKDYKEWSATSADGQELKLGISSVVRELDFLIALAGDEESFLQEFDKFAKERDIHVAAIMTAFTRPSGGFARELIVWAYGQPATAAAQRFEARHGTELDLDSWNSRRLDTDSHHGLPWRRFWLQNNVDSSRKQVAPHLRSAIST